MVVFTVCLGEWTVRITVPTVQTKQITVSRLLCKSGLNGSFSHSNMSAANLMLYFLTFLLCRARQKSYFKLCHKSVLISCPKFIAFTWRFRLLLLSHGYVKHILTAATIWVEAVSIELTDLFRLATSREVRLPSVESIETPLDVAH